MSKLEELIQQYCPDGVEWKTYYDVCDLIRGITYNKSQEAKTETEDAHKVLRANNITLYLNALNFDDVKLVSKDVVVKPEQHLYAGDILMCAGSGSKEHVGKVAYIFQDMDYTFGGFMAVVRCKKTIFSRYMFHILASHFFTSHLETQINSSTINNINRQVMQSFVFPVPPLPVQEEIVRILDTFTELQAELQAELQKRKQQYNYYLDNLLSFNDINRGGQAEVRWMKMNEVFEIRNGYTPSKAKKEFWEGGTIPWFRMEDIRQNGRILSDSILHITPKGVKGKGLFKANSFILATTATIGEHALIIADSLANQRFTNLSIRKSLENELSVKYVYYYFFVIDEWCKANTNVSNFASVDMSKFYNLLIPIPSIAEQQRIVSILDRFDRLTNDLNAGLPAEIEKRRQQYEYYRDKLLTFKRKGA